MGHRATSSCSRSRQRSERSSSRAAATRGMSRRGTSSTLSATACYAVAFDDQSMKTTGSPAPMVAGVRRATADSDGANFSISGNGTLAYIPGASSPSAGMWEIALTDRRRGIESLKLPPGGYTAPRVSPDGTRIAFGTDDGNEANIHTYDLSGATRSSDSRSEGKTGFRSGSRTTASRFSPIARAISPSSGSPSKVAPPDTPHKARAGLIACSGMTGLRRATASCSM